MIINTRHIRAHCYLIGYKRCIRVFWVLRVFYCYFPRYWHQQSYISWLPLKALLHYATCVATCLAILLRHKLQAKLQGVTCLAIIKSRNIFVARRIARSRIRFYFSQRLPQRCNTFFRHCTVSSLLQLVSQYVCWAANKNALFENSSQFLLSIKTIAREVTSNVAQCNIPDYATRILKIDSLRDKLRHKLHSVTAP